MHLPSGFWENSSVYAAFLFDKQISLACWQAHCLVSITVAFLSSTDMHCFYIASLRVERVGVAQE